MSDFIIVQNCNDVYCAYYRKHFWRWDTVTQSWQESRIVSQSFENAKERNPKLTPEEFLSDRKFTQLEEYEIDSTLLDALKDAKPCKAAPIEPVEEAPVPSNAMDVAAQCGNAPATPTFDFSALGDLSGQAAEADHQFDLHYGTAQDEYLISCIYVAKMHALTAKAGRYGGGTWTKWYESKGMSKSSVWNMLQTGEGFKGSTVEQLTLIPELTRKDLNLIARSGCAEQLTAAAGDSQRVQELLAQIKAQKERADAAEAQRDAAQADVAGLTEQNGQLKERADAAEAREEEAWKMQSKAEQRAKTAESQLSGSRQVAEAAKLRADKLKAENDALKKQPIEVVVDEEVDRRAGEKAYEIAAGMTAEYKAQQEQDIRDAYDSVLMAGRSMLNTWQIAKPSLRKLPPEQREAAANQIIRTLGQIQGEVSQCL